MYYKSEEKLTQLEKDVRDEDVVDEVRDEDVLDETELKRDELPTPVALVAPGPVLGPVVRLPLATPSGPQGAVSW